MGKLLDFLFRLALAIGFTLLAVDIAVRLATGL